MDFRRIARIFIIAFGLLNIYLIVGIVEREDIQYISTQSTENNTLENLDVSDIELPENLSTTDIQDEEIYSLQIDAYPFLEEEVEGSETHTGTIDEEGNYYISFPSNPIELEGTPAEGFTDNDYDRVSSFIQSDSVMYGDEYTFSGYDAEGNRFVFYQEVEGLPIVDGTSEISLFVNENGDIISYQQSYAGPATRQGEPLNLINGTRAIEILFLNNEFRQGSTIELPILGYRRALHLEDLSMYSPVWIVNVEHSSEQSTFRVDAVNGTIIRQPTPSPNESEDNGEEGTEETENGEEAETEAPS